MEWVAGALLGVEVGSEFGTTDLVCDVLEVIVLLLEDGDLFYLEALLECKGVKILGVCMELGCCTG